jgi:dTDP-glucose 4,6-dehydratase
VGALGTYHALGLAKAQGSVFLLASTSEIYGDPEISPQPEKYWGHVNPIGPRSVYDEAKRFAEALSMAYRREHGVKVRIVRIFNTYGDRMRLEDGRALPNFMVQALLGKPLTVYGEGNQTRSLCHVSDLVEGLHRLLVSGETGPINLGNPEEVSMLQLAEAIIRATRSKSSVVFEPLPEDDPRRRQPDITAAREKLGWEPRVSLEDGLARTIPYFQASLQNVAQAAGARDSWTAV